MLIPLFCSTARCPLTVRCVMPHIQRLEDGQRYISLWLLVTILLPRYFAIIVILYNIAKIVFVELFVTNIKDSVFTVNYFSL